MRPFDIVLLVVSAVIVIVVGFLPLFTAAEDPAARIQRECHFFYDSAGSDAVQHCLTEMRSRGAIGPGR